MSSAVPRRRAAGAPPERTSTARSGTHRIQLPPEAKGRGPTLALLDDDDRPLETGALVCGAGPRTLWFRSALASSTFAIGDVRSGWLRTSPEDAAFRVELEILSITAVPAAKEGDAGGALCEAALRIASRRGQHAYDELLARRIDPATKTGGGFNADVWDLYAKSGYFNLSGKDPGQFDGDRREVFAVNRRFDEAPDVGFRVVYSEGSRVIASVSMMHPYSGAWLGHQMAKEKTRLAAGTSKRVLTALYERAFRPLRIGPEFQWMLGYCEAHVPWMRAAHHDFASASAAAGLACVVPFRLLEISTTALPIEESGVTVDEPTPREIRELLFHLGATRPRPYVEALDLVEGRFELVGPRDAWGEGRLTRSRAALVARRRGVAIAAAIVETGERGANVFGLLDSVRVFSLPEMPGGEGEIVRARAALLRASALHLAARSRRSFVHFDEGCGALPVPGSRDLGDGYTWIVAASLRDAFLDHVQSLLSPGPPEESATRRRRDFVPTPAPNARSK